MRLLATAAGLLLIAISFVPTYVGADSIIRGNDPFRMLLGFFLFLIFASTIAAGVLLAALGIRRNLPEVTRRAWGRSVSAILGVALILGGWCLFMCAARIWTSGGWAGVLLILGFLSCLMGAIAIHRRLPPDDGRVPPETETIILPEIDENLPVVAPEPNLVDLLRTKKSLKDQGRT